MIVPKEQRIVISKVGVDAYHAMRKKKIPGDRKMAIATAAGMRRLKEIGMPTLLGRRMSNILEGSEREPDDADLEGFSEKETKLVGGVMKTINGGVDVAEAIAACQCDRRVLGAIRALLQMAIEAAHLVSAIKTASK